MNVADSVEKPVLSPKIPRASRALFLQKRLWVWPLVAAGLLAMIGSWVRWRADEAVRVQLETLLNADIEGLKIWLETQKSNAVSAARSDDVVRTCSELIAVAEQPGDVARNLALAPASQQLADELAPWIDEHRYLGYIVADR